MDLDKKSLKDIRKDLALLEEEEAAALNRDEVASKFTLYEDGEEDGEVIDGKVLAELNKLSPASRVQAILYLRNPEVTNLFLVDNLATVRVDQLIYVALDLARVFASTKHLVGKLLGEFSGSEFEKAKKYSLPQLVASIRPQKTRTSSIFTNTNIVKNMIRLRGVRIGVTGEGDDRSFKMYCVDRPDEYAPLYSDRNCLLYGTPILGRAGKFLNAFSEVYGVKIDYYEVSEGLVMARDLFLANHRFKVVNGAVTIVDRSVEKVMGLPDYSKRLRMLMSMVRRAVVAWIKAGIDVSDISPKSSQSRFFDVLSSRGLRVITPEEWGDVEYNFNRAVDDPQHPSRQWVDSLLRAGNVSASEIFAAFRAGKGKGVVPDEWEPGTAVKYLLESRAKFRNVTKDRESVAKKICCPDDGGAFGTSVTTPMKYDRAISYFESKTGFTAAVKSCNSFNYWGVATDKMGKVVRGMIGEGKTLNYLDVNVEYSKGYVTNVMPADLNTLGEGEEVGMGVIDDVYRESEAVKGQAGMNHNHYWKLDRHVKAGANLIICKLMMLPDETLTTIPASMNNLFGAFEHVYVAPGNSPHSNEFIVGAWGRRAIAITPGKEAFAQYNRFRVLTSYYMYIANDYMNKSTYYGQAYMPVRGLFKALDAEFPVPSWGDADFRDKVNNLRSFGVEVKKMKDGGKEVQKARDAILFDI